MGIADLHIHSTYSHDATTTVRGILRQAAGIGLNVIAIADHDQIRGSLEARDLAPKYGIEAIPAVEVSTRDGHLLALFVEKLPPMGLSLMDTLLGIENQGGIAIAPHPFNPLPVSLSMESVIQALAHHRGKAALRGIEVHNTSTQRFNAMVEKISVYLPLAKIASSDAHVYWAIGTGRTEFHGITAQELRIALENSATIPIPYKGKFSARFILHWARRMVLRRLGYASHSGSATQPVKTQPISAFIKPPQKKRRG